AIRLFDRIGKGVRGAPRDAMLAVWATPTTRGKVYGFHRSMDHLGAVVGPALATAFLYFYPGEYRTLFALTIVPGAIAVLLIFFVPDETVPVVPDPRSVGAELARPDATDPPPRRFHLFMGVLALFMLGNLS